MLQSSAIPADNQRGLDRICFSHRKCEDARVTLPPVFG
jgi:hypothetical protein